MKAWVGCVAFVLACACGSTRDGTSTDLDGGPDASSDAAPFECPDAPADLDDLACEGDPTCTWPDACCMCLAYEYYCKPVWICATQGPASCPATAPEEGESCAEIGLTCGYCGGPFPFTFDCEDGPAGPVWSRRSRPCE